jgi:hypothetical protein
MEDMQNLWEHGVNVWDEYKKEHFKLAGGKTGCVVCVDQTKSIYLPSSSKLVYMRHHRFLPPKHRNRQWRSHFDGMIENGEALKHRDGKFVFEMNKNINVVFEKPVKGIKRKKSEKPPKYSPFKKQSIFFRYLHIGKSSRLVMPSIPCTLRRVSSKVPSACCWISQVRQRMDLVPTRTFKLMK